MTAPEENSGASDELLDALMLAGMEAYKSVDAESFDPSPQADMMMTPSDIENTPFPVKPWAIKIRNLRMNLKLGFGTKSKIAIGSAAVGGVIGWVAGLWEAVAGVF